MRRVPGGIYIVGKNGGHLSSTNHIITRRGHPIELVDRSRTHQNRDVSK